MTIPTPNEVKLKPVSDADFKLTPKPVARPRSERSAPVRNPAFREHEGLKALQRQLNTKK